MTKTRKRRIISSITTLAMVFSFGAANAMDVYSAGDNGQASVNLGYDCIEELPDGGKIYIYLIDGMEHKFPVPPEGFKPLTATDEQLETYGFPPRPDKENQEEYEQWAELMSFYKFTKVPEIKMSVETVETDTGVSTFVAGDVNDPDGYGIAGYSSKTSGTKFYTQLQYDFIYPTITTNEVYSKNSFWVGFGRPDYNKTIGAGFTTTSMKTGLNSTSTWYGYRASGSGELKKFNIAGFNPKAGDNIHIYISFQKANNALNYYFANNTTGETKNAVIENISASTYFDGSTAAWVTELSRRSNGTDYPLGNFGTVTFKNCKAMLNTSTTWTNLGSLENPKKYEMPRSGMGANQLVDVGGIVNNNQFSFKWISAS